MKKALIMAIMFLFISAAAFCEDKSQVINISDRYQDKPIIIKTRHNEIRVWPCGKVEKSEYNWKELNPNEEPGITFDANVIFLDESTDGIVILDAD